MKSWTQAESEAVATIVVLCRSVSDASDRLTDYADGPDKAEETRTALYRDIERVRRAIGQLYALHAQKGRHDA